MDRRSVESKLYLKWGRLSVLTGWYETGILPLALRPESAKSRNETHLIQDLTPRRGRILKHVVEEYVVTAQPCLRIRWCGSTRRQFHPATVRNEMAALEDYGYLYHPHTIVGRVPSDQWYRYYARLNG